MSPRWKESQGLAGYLALLLPDSAAVAANPAGCSTLGTGPQAEDHPTPSGLPATGHGTKPIRAPGHLPRWRRFSVPTVPAVVPLDAVPGVEVIRGDQLGSAGRETVPSGGSLSFLPRSAGRPLGAPACRRRPGGGRT